MNSQLVNFIDRSPIKYSNTCTYCTSNWYILALLHSYDVKIKLSQAYDRLIHKKKILDFISPLAEHLKW